MKKIYLFAASLMLTAGAMAQTNLGFETWAPGNGTTQTTDPHPGDWSSPLVGPGFIDNDIPALLGSGSITISGVAGMPTTQQTTAPSEGTSNIGLQTFTLSGLAGPLAAYNGIHGSQVEQIIATSVKTAQISFEFKSNLSSSGDTALIFIEATGPSGGLGTNGDIIAQGVYEIVGDQATWTLDTVDLTYFTGAAIDTITIRISSSAASVFTSYVAPATDGGMIEIDDMKFLVPPVYASPATNIIASDISDNANGTDLQVTFDAAADETTVSEYRLFVIKYGYTANWNALPAAAYEVVTPTGAASYTHIYSAASICLGVSGGSLSPYVIAEDSVMDVYVLSVADGTNATANQIAGPDSTILTSPSTAGITNLSLASNEVRVYPNPARNIVNFAFENNNMATEVRVFNMTGQLINSVQVSAITTVDLNNADSGMYIYQIVGNNNEIIKTDKFQVVK